MMGVSLGCRQVRCFPEWFASLDLPVREVSERRPRRLGVQQVPKTSATSRAIWASASTPREMTMEP